VGDQVGAQVVEGTRPGIAKVRIGVGDVQGNQRVANAQRAGAAKLDAAAGVGDVVGKGGIDDGQVARAVEVQAAAIDGRAVVGKGAVGDVRLIEAGPGGLDIRAAAFVASAVVIDGASGHDQGGAVGSEAAAITRRLVVGDGAVGNRHVA